MYKFDTKFWQNGSDIARGHRWPPKNASLGQIALPRHIYTYPGPYVDIEDKFQDSFDAFSDFQDRFRHDR
jgi:hypothetical protein